MTKVKFVNTSRRSILCLCLALIFTMMIPLSAFAAVPALPGPSNPLLYDDCGGNGVWGKYGYTWANWYNQNGGTGTCTKTTVDGRTVETFAQTPASSSSWAKFQPWHIYADFSGYQYLNFTMKDPGYPDCRVKIELTDDEHTYNLSNGWVDIASDWTVYTYDITQFPDLIKDHVMINIWLNQTSGVYGEMLLDEITATSVYSGTAPTLTATGINTNSGDVETRFTFEATYTDADNEAPVAMQVVLDDTTLLNMEEADRGDFTYTDGKDYTYSTKLAAGTHSFYFRTTDGTSDAVYTTPQSITVATVTATVDINDNTTGTANNQFEYSGSSWQYNSAATGSYQSDNHYTSTQDDYVTFDFIGTMVRFYGAKDLDNGILAVSIDGGAELNVDCYSASRQETALLYTSPALENKQHTLKVRVTGEKNTSATGTVVEVDKINVDIYTGNPVESINVSQAGYNSGDYKIAFLTSIVALEDTSYQISDGSTVVASGNMIYEGITWGKHVYSIDFTSLTQTGSNYVIASNGMSSYEFPIQSNMWTSYKDEMTAFYRLQRTTDTTVSYPAGYSDIAPSTKVFHPDSYLDDAASSDGTVHYDLTGSWFDAGDYGKYGGNQWVGGEIAIAYTRHYDSNDVNYDNDSNGIPDLIDEAAYGSEYLVKFADQFDGAVWDLKNNAGFEHPEKVSDNISGTADDRKLYQLCVGGSGKAAGTLAATARAINLALANNRIDASKVTEMQALSATFEAAAVTCYDFAIANIDGNHGSYGTIGGTPNTLLWAEVQLYLLTNNIAYKTAATDRITILTTDDVKNTNYWDLRPISLAEFYPVADATVQTQIHSLLKSQMDYFMSSADDTPYGTLDEFSSFGVNEPLASYIGDAIRYYELFQDPAVLRTALKGLYWIFGNNPWNTSWVSGVGTDYVNYLHTRLDTEAYDKTSSGVIIPGAMVSGPNIKDTKSKTSVSPWYEDRPLWQDDVMQWRYNEFSISIQAGLLYSIMALADSSGNTAGGGVPSEVPITTPVIGDYVTGNVTIFAEPQGDVSAMDYKVSSYSSMTESNGVYTATVDTSTDAAYTYKKVMVRSTDSAGNMSYSTTHFTVAPPLPDPSHALLYDNFADGGTWGSQRLGWVNWYNQNGGTATYTKTTYDGRTVGKFAQTPSSSTSQAKMEPWHDYVDLSGYRYLSFTVKNPDYPNAQVRFNIEDGTSSYTLGSGWMSIPSDWTTLDFDLSSFTNLKKNNVHIIMWLKQSTGTYGEFYIDEINATNQASGTAPTITETTLNTAAGDDTTLFTFGATYTDADNQKPFQMQVVIDGVIHNMTELDVTDTTYTDGKRYSYSTKLPFGTHSYYFRTTDNTSDVVSTSTVTGPTVSPLEILYEAENLTMSAISLGDSRVTVNDIYASGGKIDNLDDNNYNDYIEYAVNVPAAGTYNIKVKTKMYSNRGICQLIIDGVNQSSTFDNYSATVIYNEFDLGNVTFTSSGQKLFRFKIVSKNTSSAGYKFVIDYIKLIRE